MVSSRPASEKVARHLTTAGDAAPIGQSFAAFHSNRSFFSKWGNGGNTGRNDFGGVKESRHDECVRDVIGEAGISRPE